MDALQPPDEAVLRQQLAEAIAVRQEAEAAVQRAEAAHERGQRRLTQCQARLASFAALEREIAERTIAALRSEDGRLSPEMTKEHETQLHEQQRAQVETQAAEAAVTTFLRERAEASQRVGDIKRGIDTLVNRILVHRADHLAHECLDLESEIVRRRTVLLAFDRYATPQRLPSSFEIQHVTLGHGTNRPLKPDEIARWTDAAEQLRADAHAVVEIDLPPTEPVYIQRPMPVLSSGVTHVVPLPAAPAVQDDGNPYLKEAEDNAAG
jgi:hypothetical protein